MPTYQYVCSACAHEFEEFQAFSDDSLTTCPKCQGELRKIYTAVGVVFKGSGFYKTDSKSSSTGTAALPTPKETPAVKAPVENKVTPATKSE